METIKIKSKNEVVDKSQLNDASLADPVSKALDTLIKNIRAGKGVDAKTLEEEGDGAVLAMFLKPIIQSAVIKLKDTKGFWKEFKGGLS